MGKYLRVSPGITQIRTFLVAALLSTHNLCLCTIQKREIIIRALFSISIYFFLALNATSHVGRRGVLPMVLHRNNWDDCCEGGQPTRGVASWGGGLHDNDADVTP